MNPRSISTRALILVAIGIGLFGLAACDPGDPTTTAFIAASQQQGNVIAAHTAGGPSDAVLARLRGCESGGNYSAVNSSGTFRGAYQFSRATWNSVARGVLPGYVNVDPAAAPPYVQDAMARALWIRSGSGQWPVCGPRAAAESRCGPSARLDIPSDLRTCRCLAVPACSRPFELTILPPSADPWSGVDSVGTEIVEIDPVEDASMGGGEHDPRCGTGIEGLGPSRCAEAPLVTRARDPGTRTRDVR